MEKDLEYELIKKFLKGNEEAFNRLILNYQKLIYWHARRMVGNHLDADEITQQVIIVLYKKLHSFKFNSSVKTWIYKITQTRCLNLIRKRKLRKFFSLENSEAINFSGNDDIVTNYEDKEKLERVNKILELLPLKQREVFVLRHFQNLSYEEISEITGKSVGGLKANYFHASKKVFRMIKKDE